MPIFSIRSLLMGIFATLTMDLLSFVSMKVHLIAPLSPRLIGRWFASVARAQPMRVYIGKLI